MIMSADRACELIGLIVMDILQPYLTDQRMNSKAKTANDAIGISSNALRTCVCADVASQQPRPGESLSAGGAHTRQGV